DGLGARWRRPALASGGTSDWAPGTVPSLPSDRPTVRPSDGEGREGGMKIAVLFDTLHPDWEDADYKKEVEAKVEEAEYDVARALLAKGHDVLMVGVAEDLG